MSDQANWAPVIEQLHARIARLEIAALALTKAMSDDGSLPQSTGEQYKQDLREFTEGLQNLAAAQQLQRLGDQWSPVFDALSERLADN